MAESVSKFPFFTLAQMFLMSEEEPMSIVYGDDKLYWVVSPAAAGELAAQGHCIYQHAEIVASA
jgi:hypothetical protein